MAKINKYTNRSKISESKFRQFLTLFDTAGPSRGPQGHGGLASSMAGEIPKAVLMGGRQHQGNPVFLKVALRTSQASEID